MKWEATDRHGMADETIAALKAAHGPDVPRLCARAMEDGKLFAAENLILENTPGSGAEVAAELAAIHAVRQYGRRPLLVTRRPDARTAELASRHAASGTRIVNLSAPPKHRDDDSTRDYHIGVLTPEKLEVLFARDPYALKASGLIVVEDAELLADARRGRGLDLVLTAAITGTRPARLLLIGRGLREAESLKSWAHAQVISDGRGPTQVHIGVVQGGTSRHRELPSGMRGTERFDTRSGKDDSDVRVRLIAEVAQRPERCVLGIRPDAARALAEAERVAARMPDRANEELLAKLDTLPITGASERLRPLLARGVGVLHGDLLPEHEAFVTTAFEQGDLAVLVGAVKAPDLDRVRATDVIPDPRTHVPHRGSHPTLEQWTRRQLEALVRQLWIRERPDGSIDPARLLLVTQSLMEADRLTRRYIAHGPCEAIEPRLLQGRLAEAVLLLIATGCQRRGEIVSTLRASLCAHDWPDLARREVLDGRLDDVLAALRRAGCISGPEFRRLSVTDLGRACLRHRLDVDSADGIASWARTAGATGVAPLEAAVVAHQSPAGRAIFVALHADERRSVDHRAELAQRAIAACVADRPVVAHLVGGVAPLEQEEAVLAKKVLVLLDWLDGTGIADIERCRAIGPGAVVRLADRTAWLLGAMADVASVAGWSENRCAELRDIARRLRERPEASPGARPADTEGAPATLRSSPGAANGNARKPRRKAAEPTRPDAA